MKDKLLRGPEKSLVYFIKWCIVAYIEGVIGGVIGSSFSLAIARVTGLRLENSWIFYLMPVGGVLIVFLYHICHEDHNRGTNMVLASISAEDEVTVATGPLIYISTIITHLVGGSAGREGAALQIGGWVGQLVGRLKFLHLDEKEKKIAVMCGMSAVFAALFGTPIAAAVFCMEVISVGIMYYAALLPCVMAALIGRDISLAMGVEPDVFTIKNIPTLNVETVQPIVLLGLLLSVLSIVFIVTLHGSEHLMKKYFPNPYVRVLVASAVFILLTLLVQTREYCGGSMSLIEKSIDGNVQWEAFLLKLIFTAIALGGGFRGGEIVPTLCVGATFGCTLGMLIGFEPSLMAACGMVGLFAAVTNCPISSILIGLELFQGQGICYFAVVVSLSFTLSGYYSLYGSQKFVYAKLKNEYLNRFSNK